VRAVAASRGRSLSRGLRSSSRRRCDGGGGGVRAAVAQQCVPRTTADSSQSFAVACFAQLKIGHFSA